MRCINHFLTLQNLRCQINAKLIQIAERLVIKIITESAKNTTKILQKEMSTAIRHYRGMRIQMKLLYSLIQKIFLLHTLQNQRSAMSKFWQDKQEDTNIYLYGIQEHNASPSFVS